jgi:hypothetical protein
MQQPGLTTQRQKLCCHGIACTCSIVMCPVVICASVCATSSGLHTFMHAALVSHDCGLSPRWLAP